MFYFLFIIAYIFLEKMSFFTEFISKNYVFCIFRGRFAFLLGIKRVRSVHNVVQENGKTNGATDPLHIIK